MKNLSQLLIAVLTLSTCLSAFAQSGPKFVPIKAATFMMGSPDFEVGREKNEKLRVVELKNNFEMQETEVTQAQWYSVMKDNQSGDRYWCKDGIEISGVKVCPDHPVNNVSYEEIQTYIKRLNAKKDGYTYRLPTEEEWEFAARAGTNGQFSFGGSARPSSCPQASHGPQDKYAWYAENSSADSAKVGSLKPNAFGLYDMHGNVKEWTHQKVLRGGAWDDFLVDLRSARRILRPSGEADTNIGFRLVRTKN